MISYVRRVFIASVAVGMLFASPTVAQDNIMTNSGAWNVAGNWSLGAMPSGATNAVIDTNVVADVSAAITGSYDGDLVLRPGAEMDGGDNTILDADYYPAGVSSRVYCKGGNRIRHDAGTLSRPLVLEGSITIESRGSGSSLLTISSPISGSGSVRYIEQKGANSSRYTHLNPSEAYTYSGSTTLEAYGSGAGYIIVDANRAFGTGDVAIMNRFELNTGSKTNVIDDGASLYFEGSGKLTFTGSETVNWLFIDGVQQATGTWGHTDANAEHTNDTHFAGTGQLTVTGSGDSSPPYPNPMSFVEIRPLTTTSIVATAATAADVNTVTYLFTNDTTGASSGWQSSPVWTNVVPAGSVYLCRVKAKDSLGNETFWSDAYAQSPYIFNTMNTSGDWSTGGNWSKGSMPSGGETAVINTNISATSGSSSAYTADLILREGAAINLGSGTSVGSFFPSGPASQAHLYEGSLLEFRDGTISTPITLIGDATIQKQDQGSTLNINSPISGGGHLTYRNVYHDDTRALQVNNSVANTYTGGTSMGPHPNRPTSVGRLLVYNNRAFGTGDVTINGPFIMQLRGATTDVIDDAANLYLSGSLAKFDLQNDSETVNKLFFDGEPQVKGTWGAAASGAENTNDTFFAAGTTGVLTVLNTDIPPSGTVLIIK